MQISSVLHFRKVRCAETNGCVPACIATVLSNTFNCRGQAKFIGTQIRRTQDGGSYFSEAGIYLQSHGLDVLYEMWCWQAMLKMFSGREPFQKIRRIIEENSNPKGIYQSERFATYFQAGGKLKFGGTVETFLKNLRCGSLAIVRVDGYNFVLDKGGSKRKRYHGVVAFIPKTSPIRDNKREYVCIYCPTLHQIYPVKASVVADTILRDPYGSVLYAKHTV